MVSQHLHYYNYSFRLDAKILNFNKYESILKNKKNMLNCVAKRKKNPRHKKQYNFFVFLFFVFFYVNICFLYLFQYFLYDYTDVCFLFSCHCNASPLFSCRNACRMAGISLCLLFRGGLAHSLWLIGLSSCQLAAGQAWLPLLLIKCFCVNLLMSRALDNMEHPQGNQPHLKGLYLSQN